MLNRLYHRYQGAQKQITYALFAVLALLQLIDLHSTLAGIEERNELNQMMLSVANIIGLVWAVAVFKVVDLVVVGTLFFCWKRSKEIFHIHFFVCLVFLIMTYTLVIINNYRG